MQLRITQCNYPFLFRNNHMEQHLLFFIGLVINLCDYYNSTLFYMYTFTQALHGENFQIDIYVTICYSENLWIADDR